ncbi:MULTISPECIES: nucleoside hydrolase [Alteromonadaceae]|jgi:inosine-uridine nucleoside N-ribohydrolase|uniref:Nucleoside hydrolase n=1 Tax=Brumicola blandensis TaxID=3075611 RepID=A0AAW8R3L4_9ALTE|nr:MULTISPECIES: nucleoside hydrolase [unclassified Alteromonas]MDT0583294.1 nucleoside hydrolase [Alteromonas sp. W409]MDT0627600.1 nucleoside hydrolase [Alteromonas sp. W364]
MTHKIILDTDPGIDDAMAIFFAFQSPDIEVLGLTTVYGNVPVTMAAQNALSLCELANMDIPVCKGVAMPWVGPESTYAHFVHGDDGFGNINHPAPKGQLDPRSSAEFIVEMARKYPGEITLVAVGPLGNLALALRLEPELPKLLKAVNLMGGAAFVPGNVTPVAEANIWNDAYAAEIVFAADWKLNMFGLDVTYDLPFPPNFTQVLAEKNPTLGGFVERSSEFYTDFYSEGKETRQCFFHDAFPIAYIVDPSLFELTEGNVRVSTDSLNKGQTIFAPYGSTASPDWTNAASINVATKVDHPRLTQMFIDTYAL